MQGSGAIGCRHDQRGLVTPGWTGVVLAEHQEACRVVWLVFDVFRESWQVVAGGRGFAGDRRRACLDRSALRRLRVTADRNPLRVGQHPVQPFVALRQRLGMRIDPGDPPQAGFAGQQVLVNAQHEFAADPQRCRQQQVHRAADRTLGRVFDGNHCVLRVPGLDLAEDIVDRDLRQQAGRVTEVLGRRRFRKGAERAEKGNSQGLFQRQAGRHDFAEEEGDVFARQRARVGFLQAAQHLRLTFGTVDVPRRAMCGLDLADLLRATGALVEQPQQFAIDAVDFGPDTG